MTRAVIGDWQGPLTIHAAKTPAFSGRSPIKGTTMEVSGGRPGLKLKLKVRQDNCKIHVIVTSPPLARLIEQQANRVDNIIGPNVVWNRNADLETLDLTLDLASGWRSPVDQWPALHTTIASRLAALLESLPRSRERPQLSLVLSTSFGPTQHERALKNRRRASNVECAICADACN